MGGARFLAIGGIGAAAMGAGLVGLLHLITPASRVNPLRRTISEYALLDTAWMFNSALLVLAVGSAAVLASLVATGVIRLMSAGGVALTLWTICLPAIVIFPKHNWAVGPSMSGTVHRAVALIGFLSLPAAALAIGWARRAHPEWRSHAYRTVILGWCSLLCFSPLAYAILSQPVTGVRWYRAVPLGAVERALALSEVIIVLVLGWWAASAGVRTVAVEDGREDPVEMVGRPA
jgi:Protein of unknown function (DUF998)